MKFVGGSLHPQLGGKVGATKNVVLKKPGPYVNGLNEY